MRLARVYGLLLLVLSAVLGGTPAVRGQEQADQLIDRETRVGEDPSQEFSQAERLLWLTDQLENIEREGKLKYQVTRVGSLGDGFTDTVELDIVDVRRDGMKSATIKFLTGERSQYVPPNDNTNVNPVLGAYLQGDVLEMNRLTNGHWRYFQKWIKLAIAEDAKLAPVTFDFNRTRIEGTKISFSPYLKDPKRERYAKYAHKRYEIIVSEDVPGMLYQIHTVIPDKAGSHRPTALIEETLTLVSAQYHK